MSIASFQELDLKDWDQFRFSLNGLSYVANFKNWDGKNITLWNNSTGKQEIISIDKIGSIQILKRNL